MSRWRGRSSRQRPFWRSAADAIILLLVVVISIAGLQRAGVFDLGNGEVRVSDGDSLQLQGQKIRLYGVDAPELKQTCKDAKARTYDCGQMAADFLRHTVANQTVSCSGVDTDRYGRAVAICRVGPREINSEIVSHGWAIAYSSHTHRYSAAQRDAQRAKRGIWAGDFEMPSAYRRRTRLMRGEAIYLELNFDD